ncbi:hypothetical protein O9992_20145 [Vibrio lentus]|nr:hypothetical protein [Vibrio lentus]
MGNRISLNTGTLRCVLCRNPEQQLLPGQRSMVTCVRSNLLML